MSWFWKYWHVSDHSERWLEATEYLSHAQLIEVCLLPCRLNMLLCLDDWTVADTQRGLLHTHKAALATVFCGEFLRFVQKVALFGISVLNDKSLSCTRVWLWNHSVLAFPFSSCGRHGGALLGGGATLGVMHGWNWAPHSWFELFH